MFGGRISHVHRWPSFGGGADGDAFVFGGSVGTLAFIVAFLRFEFRDSDALVDGCEL